MHFSRCIAVTATHRNRASRLGGHPLGDIAKGVVQAVRVGGLAGDRVRRELRIPVVPCDLVERRVGVARENGPLAFGR